MQSLKAFRVYADLIKDTILLSLQMWARFEKLSNLNKREKVLHENYIISFTRQTTFTRINIIVYR